VNFVADESVDQQIVERLREEGHAVWYIVETGPGASDEDVFADRSQKRKAEIVASGIKRHGEELLKISGYWYE
jgi:hypothetical protein